MVPRPRHPDYSWPLHPFSAAATILGFCLVEALYASAGRSPLEFPEEQTPRLKFTDVSGLADPGGARCIDTNNDHMEPPPAVVLLQKQVAGSQITGVKDYAEMLNPVRHQAQSPEALSVNARSVLAALQTEASSATRMSNDLTDLTSSLIFNGAIIVCHIIFFCVMRLRIPVMYSNNAIIGKAPGVLDSSLLGWVSASNRLTIDEIIKCAGLDCGMLMEFMNFGSKIMLRIGLPVVLIMSPLHYFFGGAGVVDPLSKIDMANVADGSSLYWIHVLIVWSVVIFVDRMIFSAQTDFMKRRFEWLRSMPPPQCTTAFVRNIPKEHCSDEKLVEYFNGLLMHDAVASAYVVRKPSQYLKTQIHLLEKNRHKLARAEKRWEKADKNPAQRPKHRQVRQEGADSTDHYSRSVRHDEIDSIDHYSQEVKSGEELVRVERERLEKAAKHGDPLVFSQDGFVTFKQRRYTELAMSMSATASHEEFLMCIPPDPSDIYFHVLEEDRSGRGRKSMLGFLLILALILSYLPVIVAISQVTSLSTLRNTFAPFGIIVDKYPKAASLWDGVVGSCALTLFMSFVPTFMMLIIRGCFNLPAENWCQHQLQHWYFYFQVTFVLLIFCIGNSLFSTYTKLVKNPTRVFGLLASTLPQAAHFYLNFFPLQMVAHASHLARYFNIAKFWWYSRTYPEAKARELSEPEDQDFYGIGARSARFTLLFVIALVFCTISPIICFLSLVDFQLCRIMYGYLIVFAESRKHKADTGGCFWITQMKHVQHGMFLYVTLMVGIFCERAGAYGPGLVAAMSYIYMIDSYRKFDQRFKWVRLPLDETVKLDLSADTPAPVGSYVQPEFCAA